MNTEEPLPTKEPTSEQETEVPKQEPETKECRYCLQSDGEFITPCKCAGTMAYIHRECVIRAEAFICPQCKTAFHFDMPLAWRCQSYYKTSLRVLSTGLLLYLFGYTMLSEEGWNSRLFEYMQKYIDWFLAWLLLHYLARQNFTVKQTIGCIVSTGLGCFLLTHIWDVIGVGVFLYAMSEVGSTGLQVIVYVNAKLERLNRWLEERLKTLEEWNKSLEEWNRRQAAPPPPAQPVDVRERIVDGVTVFV